MIKTHAQLLAAIPARFENSYMPEPNSGCWIWLRTVDAAGYGRFTIGRRGTYPMRGAHIVSYWLKHGTMPKSELDHLCKVRCCVNPDHLEPVSRAENLRRGNGFGGLNYRKTHCINGHAFTPENTYVWRGGKIIMRQCRICGRDNTRRWQQKKHAS